NDAPVNTGPPSFRLAAFEVEGEGDDHAHRVALIDARVALWVHVSTGVAYSVNVVPVERIP
ncbi:MAG: hypothetical protein IPH05_03355, partial [Flavobacteriales bacterium]|nr:hypothetical protein [Flavobacteriales bacterium]